MGFESDFVDVRTRDGRNVILLAPIIYTSRDYGRLTLPRGMFSDGASTPPAVWPWLPPFGEYWKPALAHDAAYKNLLLDEAGRPLGLPRSAADTLLREMMESCRVDTAQLEAIYEGVRIGGSWAFAEDRTSRGGA